MTKKRKWKIIPLSIFLPILIFIVWLYQTHSPLEKVYSAGRQYSYYFGFDENNFHLTKPDYYELPLPIEPKAIKQERRKAKAISDSIDRVWQYNKLRYMSEQDIAYTHSVIKKWTDFYNIDLTRAKFVSKDSICLDCPPDTSNVYYRAYTTEQNPDKRIEMFYSPDKQRYIDIGISCEMVDGKYYDFGDYDDSQAIYFTDRRLRYNHILFYFGISTGVESVFWKDNNVFFLVGRNFGEPSTNFFIYEYNIPERTRTHYNILVPNYKESRNYRLDVVMKEKGIIISY